MKAKLILALTLAMAVAAGTVIFTFYHPAPKSSEPPPTPPQAEAQPQEPPARSATPESGLTVAPPKRPADEHAAPARSRTAPVPPTKLERLSQIRESFRALAGGDPGTALRSAKEIEDENEREAALLTLVSEWRRGDLSPARERAWRISQFGLEAGLGIELAKDPQLAVLWANEMTEGAGRAAVLQVAAVAMLGSDPAGAFALGGQLAGNDRRQFLDGVFAGWAGQDTGAALDWANRMADASERDGGIQAIRTVAPVGIGAVLETQQGYPVIRELLAGTPAEQSGQIHPGDRILGLAQGNSSFVDARNLALADVVKMIRGAPGSTLQLLVLAANAPPDSPPRTISILRDQIKFKH